MSKIGLSENDENLLKKIIQEVFGVDTDVRVYAFGSRAKGKNRKNSDLDLAFKSKDSNLDQKIYVLKDLLEESNFPYKADLVNWDKIIKEYLPQINKDKKKIWDKKDAIVTSPWRVCPIGQHRVREHLKEGNKDSTNVHCRWNKSRKDVLDAQEIKEISESEIFNSVAIKASPGDMKFRDHTLLIDSYINGWCAYWNYTLKAQNPIHPNHVKALLASESSFQIKPKVPPSHKAIGIGQLMPVTIGLLSQRNKELKDHFIEITKEEAWDPNVNICASIRWLFRKYEIASRRGAKDWVEVIEKYKGISHQKGKKSEKVRNRYRELYEMLN